MENIDAQPEEVCGSSNDSVEMANSYDLSKPVLPSKLSHEEISQNAQQLIDDLNAKRKQDTQLLEDFTKALQTQAERSHALVEQYMFGMYDKQGKDVQEKLQDLFACLARIGKLDAEMQQFKQALGFLYQDVQSN